MNDFIFGIIMRQEKYCKPLLEFIIGVKIKKLVYKNEQETISSDVLLAKSICLGVYVEDDAGTIMISKFRQRTNTILARGLDAIRV